MATALETLIDAYIKRNGNQEITGPVLNGVLKAIAEALATPFIGDDGYWYIYDADTGDFVRTDEQAQGPQGPQGPEGPQGSPGPTGPEGSPGITSASVSVDANTGTPSVDASIVNKVLTLAFHNLKGETGTPGTPGTAAGFGTPSATVDANTGTPSVQVAASGPDTAKVFAFTFKNLKGAQGNPGTPGAAAGFGTPSATVDANTGTPAVTVNASGPDTAKVFSFAFRNLKGAQGNPGTPGTPGAPGAAAGFGTPTASVDANTGTPSVVVTPSGPDTAKVFDFAFHNLKGETGPTGPTGPQGPAGSDAEVTAANIASALGYTPANAADVPATYAGSPTAGGFANKAVAIPFGNVISGSTDTNLIATVDNFPSTLTDGVCAYIRNDVVSSASGFTLNINGTGALPVYQTMADASRSTTIFSASTTYLFVYNSSRVAGGCWDIYYGYNSNDNTIGYNLRTNSMSLPTTSACYRYRLLFTSANGTHFVPANDSSSTNATSTRTTTQTPIDPFGSIRYYSYTSAVNSGSRPGVAYLWEQYLITLGYSFNRTGAALTLTSWKPVYIKCAPQSDGSAIIDANNPYVQDLPTTEDGKIYIFLGVATSATQVEVVFHHPVYYYKDGSIRLWTNAPALPSIDQAPTEDSDNLVTSGGVYDALQGAGTVQDVTVGGTSVVTNKVAVIPAIPDEIDTVAVTVDSNTGTPSATGSVSGSTLSLAFHNLKGETGETGPQGPQGPQGNTGSSVDYPFTLANNLTTDDPSVALSAAQGVVLQGEVDQLEAKVDELLSDVEEDGFFITDEGGNIAACITPTRNEGWNGVFVKENNVEYEVI